MLRAVIEQLFPQVAVHRLAAPPTLPPTRTPALREARLHRGDEILGVRDEGHRTRRLQRPQAHNCRHQLRAIVGREAVAAGQFLSVLLVQEHDPIAPRAGVSDVRAVGIDRDGLRVGLRERTHRRSLR